MSASTQCPHSEVDFHINVASFGDTNIRYLEVKGACKICGEPIRFVGEVGLSPHHPTVSLGGAEVSIPMMFGEEPYDGRAAGYSLTIER